jgi:hypothetical protein
MLLSHGPNVPFHAPPTISHPCPSTGVEKVSPIAWPLMSLHFRTEGFPDDKIFTSLGLPTTLLVPVASRKSAYTSKHTNTGDFLSEQGGAGTHGHKVCGGPCVRIANAWTWRSWTPGGQCPRASVLSSSSVSVVARLVAGSRAP